MSRHDDFWMNKGFIEAKQVRIDQERQAKQTAQWSREATSRIIAQGRSAPTERYSAPTPRDRGGIVYGPPQGLARAIAPVPSPRTVQLPPEPMLPGVRIYMIIAAAVVLGAGLFAAAYFTSVFPLLNWWTAAGALLSFVAGGIAAGALMMQFFVAGPIMLTIVYPAPMALVWSAVSAGSYWYFYS